MLRIGIVGLPNVGKSTLFNALTRASVPAENYPFCTIDPSVGIVAVPDKRLTALSSFSQSAETIPAVIEFVDIAGLVAGASKGEGLGNQFLSHIREVDAILHLVRIFEDADITHVHGHIDPIKDIEVITLELIYADSEQVQKRREKIVRDIKQNKKEAVEEDAVLEKLEKHLAEGKPARQLPLSPEELAFIRSLNLLSLKPTLYGLNYKGSIGEVSENIARVRSFVESEGSQLVIVDARTEHDLSSLSDDDKNTFRGELGVENDGIQDLIARAYDTLGLITFFTTGEKETRAWTIVRGQTAPEAGSVIHTDFMTKFIRAEVIATETLLSDGSYARARELGHVRTEGKTYMVLDGDVMVFLHS